MTIEKLEEENFQLWVAEAERRLNDLRTGKTRTIPAADVLKTIRETLM